jgi:ElaB/YqjD/DUF883 family membrane-anchored ribosome-binding protein
MTQSIPELEREIEASRARLDRTIDRIQDRLSVSGIVDEVVGSVRTREFGAVIDHALSIVRRNPVPVILVAAGVGWLIHRMSQERRPDGAMMDVDMLEEESIPVLNTGQARVYDPDVSPRHPTHDVLETRRDVSARA